MSTSLAGISVALPNGRFVNFAGENQGALPNAMFTSGQIVPNHLYLGPSSYYSWWVIRPSPNS